MRHVREATLLAVALAAGGCVAGGGIPLPESYQAARWPYGARIDAEHVGRGRTMGELIAITPDSVHILTDHGLTALPLDGVSMARLRADRTHHVRTPEVSEGWNRRHAPGEIPRAWKPLIAFARYPGGIPPGLDLGTLALPATWR